MSKSTEEFFSSGRKPSSASASTSASGATSAPSAAAPSASASHAQQPQLPDQLNSDSPERLADKITLGTRVTLVEDSIVLGNVRIGSQTVVHPRASILALGGPIVLGTGCLIEEEAVVVNRGPGILRIGDYNYFEVGSRVEAASVGSHNTFEVRCFVASGMAISSHCTVGAGCSLYPNPIAGQDVEALLTQEFNGELDLDESEAALNPALVQPQPAIRGEKPELPHTPSNEVLDKLPDRTVVFGFDARRRVWSGEGVKQQAALHIKHLDYLRDSLPKTMRLKLIKP